MFIFDRCRPSSAAVTVVKYECDANNVTGTFARLKILLTEKLMNGALVTPTPGPHDWQLWSMVKQNDSAEPVNSVKVRLHGTRQAARLAHDMLQRDLLRGNSIYMVNCVYTGLQQLSRATPAYNPCIGSFWGRCSSKKLRQLLATACAAQQS